MGMGQQCNCNLCDFVFFSGHSHHEGSSNAMCLGCQTRFALPTASPWGPAVAELIELHIQEKKVTFRHKKKPPQVEVLHKPTGVYLLAEPGKRWGVHYPIETLDCPSCHRAGSLVLDFEEGQACPSCRLGVLACSAVEY